MLKEKYLTLFDNLLNEHKNELDDIARLVACYRGESFVTIHEYKIDQRLFSEPNALRINTYINELNRCFEGKKDKFLGLYLRSDYQTFLRNVRVCREDLLSVKESQIKTKRDEWFNLAAVIYCGESEFALKEFGVNDNADPRYTTYGIKYKLNVLLKKYHEIKDLYDISASKEFESYNKKIKQLYDEKKNKLEPFFKTRVVFFIDCLKYLKPTDPATPFVIRYVIGVMN